MKRVREIQMSWLAKPSTVQSKMGWEKLIKEDFVSLETTSETPGCVHKCLGTGVWEEERGRPHVHEHWLSAEGGVGAGDWDGLSVCSFVFSHIMLSKHFFFFFVFWKYPIDIVNAPTCLFSEALPETLSDSVKPKQWCSEPMAVLDCGEGLGQTLSRD